MASFFVRNRRTTSTSLRSIVLTLFGWELVCFGSEKRAQSNSNSPQEVVSPSVVSPEEHMTKLALPITPRYRYWDLSRFGQEVSIEHEGQTYRLRTTRNGKLILIK